MVGPGHGGLGSGPGGEPTKFCLQPGTSLGRLRNTALSPPQALFPSVTPHFPRPKWQQGLCIIEKQIPGERAGGELSE